MWTKYLLALFAFAFLLLGSNAEAVTDSDIGIDPPTLHSLGFSVPYSGAQVIVEYRVQGTGAYQRALDMLEIQPGQFAGSILDLQSGTPYEVKFTFGNTSITKVVRTQEEPLLDPKNKNIVVIPDDKDLNSALNNAQPGDVLFLKNGIYQGPIVINRSGTKDNPIILRGESLHGVIIESPERFLSNDDEFLNVCYRNESNLRIEGSHIYVENITFRGEYWGANIESSSINQLEDVVIRNTKFTNVYCGIRMNNNMHINHFICNNILEGKLTNEDTGRKTWNISGISITGQGHSICNNTLSGFGDTIDVPDTAGIRAIDIFNNDILFGGDDGLELDGGERNIRAFRNRISNSGTGISVQPGGGGPFYLYRNIIYNAGLAYNEGGVIYEPSLPFKLKNGASGLYIFHNTTIRPGVAWSQGEAFSNSQMYNNLFLGTTGGATFGISPDSQIDFNGFNKNSPYGSNGVQLSLPIFDPPDAILASGTDDWTAYYLPDVLELNPKSAAVDHGKILYNINDDYTGTAPDLGAHEIGQPTPIYGVTLNDSTAPSGVSGVSTSGASATMVELNWSAASDAESGISGYVVYRDGTRVGTVTGTSYQDTGLSESSVYSYEVAAVNGAGLEGPRSGAVSGATLADLTAPTLVSVSASGDPTQVLVGFSEPVLAVSAEQASNYTINNGVAVNTAALEADGMTVRLTTSVLSEGVTYRLTVENVYDQAVAANVISPGSGRDFEYVAALGISGTQPSTYEWGKLAVGEGVYVDRDYTYSGVPTAYTGLDYLRTSNDDKFVSGAGSVSFEVNQPVVMYVGYDTRNMVLPSWLQGWTDTGDELTTTDGTLHLYAASYTAGTVSLGGNEMGNSMYVVLMKGATGTVEPLPPAPSPVPPSSGGDTGTSDGTTASASATSGGGGGSLGLVTLLSLLLFALFCRSRRYREL